MRIRHCVPVAAALLIGLGLGRSLPTLRAGGEDRWGESVVVSGPIEMRPSLKAGTIPLDAVYHLNYATGRLLAMVPLERRIGGKATVLTDWAERDLVADFGLPKGLAPHFLMTTADLGSQAITTGWAPLLVFETTTGKVATYKVSADINGRAGPSFELLELRADPRLAHPGGGH